MAIPPGSSSPIYFITVNYHCGDYIRGLIEAIIASGEELDSLKFIIVNNSPADQSLRPWLEAAPIPLPVQWI